MNFLKKIFFPMLLVFSLAIGLTACDTTEPVAVESITISASDVTNVMPGNSVVLEKTVTPTDADLTGMQWQIVEGADHCSMSGDVLVVKTTAPTGATIKVKAVCGEKESNELSFTVGYPITSVTVSSTASAILRQGATYPLSLTLAPVEATAKTVQWVVSNENYASVVNNVLFVNEDVPFGSALTVKAIVDGVESNVLEYQVGVAVTNIQLSSTAPAILKQGANYPLSIATTPTGAAYKIVEWNVSNEDYASVINNTLYVSEDVPFGATLTVKAIVDGVESNVLEYQVGVAISSIQVSSSATSVKKGAMAILTAVTNQGATEGYEWIITQGDDYADVLNGTLVVDANAPTNAIIKVKAQSASGAVSSDEISITVLASDEEIRETTYYLVLSTDSITIDKNGTSTPTLTAEIYNLNGVEVTDKQVLFTLSNGSDAYVGIEATGNVCRFTQPKAHGTAYVNVTIDGTEVSEQATINVICPPDAIALPEVFSERSNYAYNFSMKEPGATEEEQLPFVAEIITTTTNANPCEEIVYSFTHEDESKGDAVATYVDGKIIFHKLGKTTVTVSSNSGSRIETSVSYTFNINEGYNAFTFEEAGAILRSANYNGQEVNFVAVEKMTGWHLEEENYDYGYSLVPAVALQSHATQRGNVDDYDSSKTDEENKALYASLANTIKSANNRIVAAAYKSLHINGNKHKVDASNLYVPSETEINRYQTLYDSIWDMHGAIISVEPWTGTSVKPEGSYFARVYDVEVVGNAPLALKSSEVGQGDNQIIKGVYQAGINVGNINDGPNAKYYVDIKNVTASACYDGIKIANAVGNSIVENAYANNCYANGMGVKSSILTIKNLKIGACGATGIELQPENSALAGLDSNQPQTVTFEGTIEAEDNIHGTNTPYMNAYNDGQVPQIIAASIALNALTTEQQAHIMTSDGALCLVAFMLDYSVLGGEGNASQAIYAAYQEGGIIEATQISGTDNTHQFIRLNVYAGPGVEFGSALLYNLNYGKTA